jgi:hypothetical protein
MTNDTVLDAVDERLDARPRRLRETSAAGFFRMWTTLYQENFVVVSCKLTGSGRTTRTTADYDDLARARHLRGGQNSLSLLPIDTVWGRLSNIPLQTP